MNEEKKRRPPRREDWPQRREQEAEADGLIEGRNAVIEALRSGAAIDKVYLRVFYAEILK